MLKIHLESDIGPSIYGVESRGLVRSLLESGEVSLNLEVDRKFRDQIESEEFCDTRFKEYLLRNSFADISWFEEGNQGGKDFMIQQFESGEDVWLGIGEPGIMSGAPSDEKVHRVLLTGFREEDLHDFSGIGKIDEIRVLSRRAKRRLEQLEEIQEGKVKIKLPGISSDYESTKYDCRVCPKMHKDFRRRNIENIRCLKDGKFNFLMMPEDKCPKRLQTAVKSFLEEFGREEDVRLFIDSSGVSDIPVQQLVKSAMAELGNDIPTIGINSQPLRQQYLYDLLGHTDVFIRPENSLSRIRCLQSAYAETPVIMENFPESSRGFIELEEYSQEYLRKKMRQLFQEKAAWRKSRGRKARELVEERYNTRERTDELLESFQEVVG